MLKETETEETRPFDTFLSLVAFRLGEGAGPLGLPPSYTYSFGLVLE